MLPPSHNGTGRLLQDSVGIADSGHDLQRAASTVNRVPPGCASAVKSAWHISRYRPQSPQALAEPVARRNQSGLNAPGIIDPISFREQPTMCSCQLHQPQAILFQYVSIIDQAADVRLVLGEVVVEICVPFRQ